MRGTIVLHDYEDARLAKVREFFSNAYPVFGGGVEFGFLHELRGDAQIAGWKATPKPLYRIRVVPKRAAA